MGLLMRLMLRATMVEHVADADPSKKGPGSLLWLNWPIAARFD